MLMEKQRYKISALILGAGDGGRMNNQPKAFLEKGDNTFLEHAINQVTPYADEIIAGVRAEDLGKVTSLNNDKVTIIAGGSTRQKTLENLVNQSYGELLLIHEVARPNATGELFRKVIETALTHDIAMPYIHASIRDAVALKDGDTLKQTLLRKDVVRVQTPQACKAKILKSALKQAKENNWDESSNAALFLKAGYQIKLIPSVEENIKVTYPEDLSLI